MIKILLADDSEIMGKISHILLRNYQVSLKQCFHSKETINALDCGKYDLLILSSSLKGFRHPSELHKFTQGLKNIPVLLIEDRREDKHSAKQRKENYPFTLSKPFRKEDFYQKLSDCGLSLERKKSSKQKKPLETPVKQAQTEEVERIEELNFHDTEPEPITSEQSSPNLKELEGKITESLCHPGSNFYKILQHMIKEEIQNHGIPLIEKHCKEELKTLIAEHLRGELQNLSQKKKSLSSPL